MFRLTIAVVVLAFSVTVASAQPRQLPLSPGVMPGSPWGPGMQFLPSTQFGPQRGVGFSGSFGGGLGYRNALYGYGYGPSYGYGYGGLGLGYGGYGYGGFGYGYPFELSPLVCPEPQSVCGGYFGQPPRIVPLSGESPAQLTIQFPVAADVWLDNLQLAGEPREEETFFSRALTPNEQFTFNVKARWKSGGKIYEMKRSVTVRAGERSRLLIVSGEVVKE